MGNSSLRESFYSLLYFLLAVLVFQLGVFLLNSPEEVFEEVGLERFPGNVIAWKLRDHIKPGQKVSLSAQHRFAGKKGRLRYVMFETIWENFDPPKLVEVSPYISTEGNKEWSSWTFEAKHPVVFFGVAWETAEVPIYIQRKFWTNKTHLNDYAYKGNLSNKERPLDLLYVPVKANFKVSREDRAPPFYMKYAWVLLLCVYLLFIYLWFKGPIPSVFHLIVFVAGLIFAFRLEASYSAPFWTWGAYYISFLENSLIQLLLGLFLLFLLIFISQGDSLRRDRAYFSNVGYLLFSAALIFCAVYFPCNRRYHDWIYSITNQDHAPLTSAVFGIAEKLFSRFKQIADFLPRLFSLLVLVPFLYFLRKLLMQIEGEDEPAVWGVLFFLSLSTFQLFFSYVGIHSLPVFYWVLFAYLSFRVIEGKTSLFYPTITAFAAYMSHLSEAVLIFPLLFLWIHQIRSGKLSWPAFFGLVFVLGVSSLLLTAFTNYSLFHVRFDGDAARFNQHFTHYGFEILWGAVKHPGLSLPWFEILNYPGSYTPPGPRYAAFSFDNLVRVVNTGFHFSAFCLILPILILLFNKGKELRDPRILFSFIAFAAYLIYMFVAYVGWIPVIRDWDLFAIFSVISATLLYLQLRRRNMNSAIVFITLVNLLQTVPWILINHYPFELPW